MAIAADATRIAKSLAASDAGNHSGRQSLRHQRRPLFDVQFQVGADARWIEEPPPLSNRLRLEAAFDHRGLETSAIVRSRYGKACGIEQSECPPAAKIGDVEPGGLFSADPHDRDVAVH